MAEPTAGPEQWLTVSEAASRLGWHPDRVKSALRRGRLQARKNNAGKWMGLVPPVMPDRANGSAGRPPGGPAPRPGPGPATRPAAQPGPNRGPAGPGRAGGG